MLIQSSSRLRTAPKLISCASGFVRAEEVVFVTTYVVYRFPLPLLTVKRKKLTLKAPRSWAGFP